MHQGSGLSPLLFSVFIDDIADRLPEGVEVSLFADDLALWVSDTNIGDATRLLQQGLNTIDEWAEKNKMNINVGKCETTLFTTHNGEASVKPSLRLRGAQFPSIPTQSSWGLPLTAY